MTKAKVVKKVGFKIMPKNNGNKFFMLKCNSVNVHSNTTTARSAKMRTGWPYMILEIFVNGLAKSPRVL